MQDVTIQMDDFDYVPIFERVVGKGKARKVFPGELEALLEEINAAIGSALDGNSACCSPNASTRCKSSVFKAILVASSFTMY